jgi:hypothetical protein
LNESYVFCLRRRASDITREVKKALEQEGYEGDAMSVVDRSQEGGQPGDKRTTQMREEFRRFYRKFEGKVYLPRFCVRNGKDYEALDYHRHLVSQVAVERFDYEGIDWDMADDLAKAKESFYRLTLDQETLERVAERDTAILETDDQVVAWIIASLPFEHYSFKQLRRAVARVIERLRRINGDLAGRLPLIKFAVREKIAGFIEVKQTAKPRQLLKSSFRASNSAFICNVSKAVSRYRRFWKSKQRAEWCMPMANRFSSRSSITSLMI